MDVKDGPREAPARRRPRVEIERLVILIGSVLLLVTNIRAHGWWDGSFDSVLSVVLAVLVALAAADLVARWARRTP